MTDLMFAVGLAVFFATIYFGLREASESEPIRIDSNVVTRRGRDAR